MNTAKYSAPLRVIHWLMAVLIAFLLISGAVMIHFKESEPWTLYNLHKSSGVLVFLLILLRIFLRLGTPRPSPAAIPRVFQIMGAAAAGGLYLLMVLVPISGYALSNTHGHGVKFFGLPLPGLFSAAPDWESLTSLMHFSLAYAMLALILLHIAGVVFHQARGEDILSRMS